jgi:hypothetical protein
MTNATARHESQTHWQFVMTQFANTFGAELLNQFLDTPKRDQFSFVQAYFQEQPLAACVLYAIHESIINANDDHGHAAWSKGWDDCFGATFSMWLDDWSMIEHSGLWRLEHEIWNELGKLVHTYSSGGVVLQKTLAEITLNFWEAELKLAKDCFLAFPASEGLKEELLEIADNHAKAFRAWTIGLHSNAKDQLLGGGF